MNPDELLVNLFYDREVFIVGGGPSLLGFDFSRLKGKSVIAVNHAYGKTDHDLMLHYDANFLAESKFEPKTHRKPVLSGMSSGVQSAQTVFPFARSFGISTTFHKGLFMHPGCSSSIQPAINAALIGGAKLIYLMGVDGRFFDHAESIHAATENGHPEAADGIDFCHHHTQKTCTHKIDNRTNEYKIHKGIVGFKIFRAHPVINLSRLSIIDCFQKMHINDVLK